MTIRSVLSWCLVFLATAGCSTVPRQTDFAAPFQQACAEVASEPNVPAGSPAESAAIQRVKQFLGSMTRDSVDRQTLQVYAPRAYLNDTLTVVRGNQAIQEYFRKTVESVHGIDVEFQDVTRSTEGYYYFRWIMRVKMKAVSEGETVVTPGISLVRFDADGRVLIQQDFWDSAAGLFQHVPGIGYGIRAVKARI